MRLYAVRSNPAFTLLCPVSDHAWVWRGGEPVLGWPDRVTLTLSDTDREFIAANCFELITGVDGLVLSDFAREKLETLLAPAGEFWPVSVEGRAYWWFNCLACVEALNRERTDADWGLVQGDWGSFQWITSTRRLAFDASRLGGVPAIFRVPEYPRGVLFGTEALGRAIHQEKLTGFGLEAVWSDADGGVLHPPGISLGALATMDESELRRCRAEAIELLGQRR